jgi:hypothetical protein
LVDRGTRFGEVFYTFSDEAQIGLLHSPGSLSFTLYRYIPYLTRRWERTRERDYSASVALSSIGLAAGTFVGIPTPLVAAEAIKNIFGIRPNDYRKWLDQLLREAQAKRTGVALPPVLHPECELLEFRRHKLDALRQVEIPFEMLIDNAEPPSVGEHVMLSLIGRRGLESHLKALGYSRIGERMGLGVSAEDDKGRRLSGLLRDLICEPPDNEFIDVELINIDPGFSSFGRLRLNDPGSDAVVKSEETIVRELKFSIAHNREDTAVHRAWSILRKALSVDPLSQRSSADLWNGVENYVEHADIAYDDFEKEVQSVDSQLGAKEGIQLLTGAPGTGKTRIAARSAHEHLQSRSIDDCPPSRILVVAASHFGIDNFLRSFLNVSKDRWTVFRNIPRLRIAALRNTRVLDADLHDAITRSLDRQRSALPAPNARPSQRVEISQYMTLLQSRFRTVEALRMNLGKQSDRIIVSSHERWRKLYEGASSPATVMEIEQRARCLRNRLIDLEGISDADVKKQPGETYTGENLYLQLGSDVIATTPDAFGLLPDLAYSLVIFEEASQLASLKILKVLTKALRASPKPPMILMAGDPCQLPPYTETRKESTELPSAASPKSAANLQSEEVILTNLRRLETPFERMCNRNAAINLTTQYRMHSDIATLVNSLFYSQQTWTSARSNEADGVIWINTHSLSPSYELEDPGSSRFNRIEVEVIKMLVKERISPKSSVLVVSPYSAQVSLLLNSLDRSISVRTIDGCQGVEADVVIVSFVTLSISETRDFVADPRRMNVAFSRARDALYLVGDMDELRDSIDQLPKSHRFSHLLGLARMFGNSGYFRSRLINWQAGK